MKGNMKRINGNHPKNPIPNGDSSPTKWKQNGDLQKSSKQNGHHSSSGRKNIDRLPRSKPNDISSRSWFLMMSSHVTPLRICVVTFVFRLLHVLDRDSWWMVHPDEVFQSMEIGHIGAFGYGFRSYEFSPLMPSANDTRYRQMLLESGLAALRSPIFPYFYTLVFTTAYYLRIQVNPFLVAKVAHITVTSLLPASVYLYTKVIFKSHNTGLLAAVFTATSVHLNVYGVRCFLQSFLSPFTFLALALMEYITDENVPPDPISTKEKESTITPTCNGRQDIATSSCNGVHQTKSKNGIIINGNHNVTHGSYDENIDNTYSKSKEISSTLKNSNHNSIASNELAKNGDCKSHTNGGVPTLQPDVNSSYNNGRHIFNNRLNSCATGFLFGLSVYIRPDVLLIHAVNTIFILSRKKNCLILILHNILYIVLGTVGAVIAGSISDRVFYGQWVVSPFNWIATNVLSDLSTGIFGKMKPWFYVDEFINQDCIFSIVCLISIIALLVVCVLSRMQPSPQNVYSSHEDRFKNKTEFTLCARLLSAWIVILIVYSMHGHKEMRFAHDCIIFMFIFIAGVIKIVNQELLPKLDNENNIKHRVIALFTAFAIVSQYTQYPSAHHSHKWTYQNTEDSQSINSCLEFVSSQTDTRGLFLDSSMFMTGGMTILHRNIPILSLLLDGFFEFGYDARLNMTSSNGLFPLIDGNLESSNQNSLKESMFSMNSFTQSSNYVSYANAPAVLRIILSNQNYNYVILRKDRQFIKIGFEEVFQTGNQRVLKRTDTDLSYLVERIPLGSNATILTHEGDVLSYLNRCEQAVERFQASLHIKPDMIETYLPLHSCLLKLGHRNEAIDVMSKCFQISTKEKCSATRPLISV